MDQSAFRCTLTYWPIRTSGLLCGFKRKYVFWKISFSMFFIVSGSDPSAPCRLLVVKSFWPIRLKYYPVHTFSMGHHFSTFSLGNDQFLKNKCIPRFDESLIFSRLCLTITRKTENSPNYLFYLCQSFHSEFAFQITTELRIQTTEKETTI